MLASKALVQFSCKQSCVAHLQHTVNTFNPNKHVEWLFLPYQTRGKHFNSFLRWFVDLFLPDFAGAFLSFKAHCCYQQELNICLHIYMFHYTELVRLCVLLACRTKLWPIKKICCSTATTTGGQKTLQASYKVKVQLKGIIFWSIESAAACDSWRFWPVDGVTVDGWLRDLINR